MAVALTDAGGRARWHLYIVRTRFDTLYTGITTDLARRIAVHNSGKRGSKYLRAKAPLKLEYSVRLGSRSTALKAESRLKKLTRKEKEQIVRARPTAARLLHRLGL